MKQQHRSSQPLEITGPVRVALVVIALAGLAQWANDAEPVGSLTYLDDQNPTILRSVGQTHAFETLGVSITPPDGWTYLSVTDDVVASQPTFVNTTHQSMLRLLSTDYFVWSDKLQLSERRYEDATVEWIDWKQRRLTLTIDDDGTPLKHSWDETDPRKIGRLSRDGGSVAVMALSHGISADLNQSVGEFCAAIRFITDRNAR